MDQDNQNKTINSPSVEKQLNQLEEQNTENKKSKKGSTNEIQPMAVDEGLTQ